MHPRSILISFSGIDGTGKSTIAHRIQEFLLNDHGIPTRYVWCKFGDHPLSRYRLGKFVKPRQITKSGPSHSKGKRPSSLFKSYGMALLAFHLAQIAFTVRGTLQRGQSVICDRYIFDTMVDLQQDLGFPMSRVRKILEAQWIPPPGCKFLLDLAEDAAFARKADSVSVAYLKTRRTMYLDIAREYGLQVIDASQPVDSVVQIVLEQIRTNYLSQKDVHL